MTLETAAYIIVIAGLALIVINGLRPKTQPHSEPLGESWNYHTVKDADARREEVLLEDNALRELLKVEAPAGSIAQVPSSLQLPEYAESTRHCGAGSVIQIILLTRSYCGELLPEDLAEHLTLTPIH